MWQTENFRKHHKEVLDLTTKISNLLSPGLDARDAASIRSLLSVLSGKLTIHLALEDKDLYPRMIAHKDLSIATMARTYKDEMGGLSERFGQYTKKWSTPASIQTSPSEFSRETTDVFRALHKRINKEDNELYCAFDRIS